MPAPPPFASRNALRRWLAGTAAAAAGAAMVAAIGPREIARTLGEASWQFVFLSFAAYAAFFAVRGARWSLLLREAAPGTTVAAAASLSAVGWLVSTFVPFKGGDLTRVALLARRERAPMAAVAGSVALERSFDLLGLAAAASLGLGLWAAAGGPEVGPVAARAVALAWLLPLAAVAGLLTLALLVPARRRTNQILRLAGQALDAARFLRENPRRLAPLAGQTMAAAALQVLVFVFLVRALAPAIGWLSLAAGVPLFLLSFAVAITPGHVGTYEAAFVAVFALLGAGPEGLLAVALAAHVMTASMVGLLGALGFVGLAWLPRSQAAARADAEARA